MGLIQSQTLQAQSFQVSSANSHFHHYALPPSLWFSICHCSVAQSCDPMDCRMPGFPVLHYLLEFAQTHVHWVNDAIQSSHPLSSPLCRYIFLKNYIQSPIHQNSRKNKRYWLLAHAAPQFQFFSLWNNYFIILHINIHDIKMNENCTSLQNFNHLRWLASKYENNEKRKKQGLTNC